MNQITNSIDVEMTPILSVEAQNDPTRTLPNFSLESIGVKVYDTRQVQSIDIVDVVEGRIYAW